jgi:predicted phage replisome organizer
MGGDVFWIKLQTSTFDSETIMLLESMPEGDTILIIWFKMQILAGKCNANGYLLLNGENPYSDEMLATVFRRSLNSVRLAISAFLKFKMVEIIDGSYFLPEWEKHQNVGSLDKIREQTKQRVARYRAKAKGVTLQITHGNAAETETEIDLEKQQHEIRLLLENTPFRRLTDQELRSLAERHGGKQLMLAADIAVETWHRDKEEIHNPGGYLQSLCSSLIIPSWYHPLEDRKKKAQETEERKLASRKAQEDKKAEEEKELQAREAYWASVSETDQDKFHCAAKESMNPGFELPSVAIAAIAKNLAWESRTEMNTN